MAVIQPRYTHILYQCAKCGDDRTSLQQHIVGISFIIIQNIYTYNNNTLTI